MNSEHIFISSEIIRNEDLNKAIVTTLLFHPLYLTRYIEAHQKTYKFV
jgi:hypothetical protein